jgi:ubiquinone/menaquinone biosynthesis C-methylase UbiE
VHSLDLVASAPGVIACNMAHTPLDAASCDAAVFSLALMGTDYGAFLQEAARVLKDGGRLWIAEVSRVVECVVWVPSCWLLVELWLGTGYLHSAQRCSGAVPC